MRSDVNQSEDDGHTGRSFHSEFTRNRRYSTPHGVPRRSNGSARRQSVQEAWVEALLWFGGKERPRQGEQDDKFGID